MVLNRVRKNGCYINIAVRSFTVTYSSNEGEASDIYTAFDVDVFKCKNGCVVEHIEAFSKYAPSTNAEAVFGLYTEAWGVFLQFCRLLDISPVSDIHGIHA